MDLARPREKEFHTRYFTYYLIFKHDDHWQQSIPFIHDLDFELTRMKLNSDIRSALKRNGSATWVDKNNVTHMINITEEPVPTIWGLNKTN